MLHEFLKNRRSELITRWTLKVAKRPARGPQPIEAEAGIPFFLDQLEIALQTGQGTRVFDGRAFLRRGFTSAQIVHDCGDLGEAIGELAFEYDAIIGLEEFRMLDRCLDNAIAAAVVEYSCPRKSAAPDHVALPLEERLDVPSFELQDRIHAATLALTAIRLRYVAPNGATAAVLHQSLTILSSLVDPSLADVRGTARLARNGGDVVAVQRP